MTTAAGVGGGVGGGRAGGAYFVVALLFVFGFSLEDSAEAADEWAHCPFFFGWLALVGGEGEGGGAGGGGGGVFSLCSSAYFGVGMEMVMRSRCGFLPSPPLGR